ncbi:M20 family metallopeptidase [Salarchaeum sp. JOR-1]|uniref:M20 family metallopeptidase n=1 Tax=Salarchaeum sp. JOR-1 TaxID=2599399 RepID=UPI0011985051|nr:M20 family metallopeptidase [Salarchaeum sp. JOR-1]QDX39624.1 M20 family metallopeptidase [Salarchaeum sp. JOR-1]
MTPVDFLERAVRTPSHENVDAMRELLLDELAAYDPAVDDAGNVLASRGSGRPHVVLNTHIDTVPPHVPARRDGDTLYGRGSCDAKGPLAALLAAFDRISPESGRVTLAVTPDEETDSTGAHALDLGADGYIVGEPTGLNACTSARGRFQGTVELGGEGAHAAQPQEGANAIQAAAPVLDALDAYDDEHGPSRHAELGPPTLVATKIRGGDATNRVPSEAVVTFDRRSVPPETEADFFAGFADHVGVRVPDDVTATVARAERDTPFLEAFHTPSDASVVEALVAAGAGRPRPFGAATEASYFAADAPTVVFGPGDLAVAHSSDEYVDLREVERAADIVTDALAELVG